jgi:glycosyltransferase involved in cell wall biosynthesis
LAQRGDQVDVISLQFEGQHRVGNVNGVKVFRIQKRIRNEKSKLDYLYRIIKFLFNSFLFLSYRHLKNKYDLVHVHSIPDFEVFAALLPKLSGSKIILDIHDIVPELFCNKFQASKDSIVFKLLVLIEKLSSKFADHVIISNHLWKRTICSRSVLDSKCTTILNYPDSRIFFRKIVKNKNKHFIFMYPGTLNYHQGLDLAIVAFSKINDNLKNAELHIIGDGPEKSNLKSLSKNLGIQDRVIFKEPVTLDEIPQIMGQADVGIVPKRNDGFGSEAFSTKSLEFMSLGVPLIIARTKIDQYYFSDDTVCFFEPESTEDLSKAMLALYEDDLLRAKYSQEALDFCLSYKWDNNKPTYFRITDS